MTTRTGRGWFAGAAVLALVLAGCGGDEVLAPVPDLTAGAAERVITPTGFETYTDLNDNHQFDGELDNPAGDPSNGVEPFDDANGNGHFDAIWLAGGDMARAANTVHDDLKLTTLVLADGLRTVAFLGVDSLGIYIELRDRIAAELAERDVVLDMLLLASSHTHAAPDGLGVFGFVEGMSGIDTSYFDFLTAQAADAIEEAYRARVPAELTIATTTTPLELGQTLQYDRRDPNIIDNDLAVARLDARDGSGTIGTLINWPAHPEFNNNKSWITADYVGSLRNRLGEIYPGSTTVFMNGAQGGQIGPTDAVFDYDGVHYARDDESWEKMDAVADYVAELATTALDEQATAEPGAIIDALDRREVLLPVANVAFRAMFNLDVFVYKKARNADGSLFEGKPKISDELFIRSEVSYLKLDGLELLTAPGEVHPELVIGGYDGSRRDPNYPFMSDDNPNPDDILDAPAGPYWKDYLTGPVKMFAGLTNDELGYIIAPFNFALNPDSPWFEEWTNHHYEETYSLGPETANVLDAAYRELTGQP